MRRITRLFVASLLAVAAVVAGAQTAFAFSDVPSSYWDYSSIVAVASTHTWMQDYGTGTFKPKSLELRKYLARSLVKIWAPNETESPKITFGDLPKSDPFYHYANIAAKLGWMPKFYNGNWAPDQGIHAYGFDKAITRALGLSSEIAGLANIHEKDGDKYTVNEWFPYMQLAKALDLHYNHADETLDINWLTYMKRDEIAYSIWKAYTLQSWQISNLSRFNSVELAALPDSYQTKHDLTAYMLNQVGKYPYIYGGEWNAASPSGYCCGTQPQAGMDCSGFAWWTVKKYENGYNAAKYHPAYAGWSLLQRSSSDMAHNTSTPVAFADLEVGDLMFFASNGGSTWSDVDHVGVYVGNGWMIHTASSNDGAVLEYVGSGWYYDEFVYGRRLIGASSSGRPTSPAEVKTAGDRA